MSDTPKKPARKKAALKAEAPDTEKKDDAARADAPADTQAKMKAAVLDAALITSAQAVEHYEMCRYGTLIAWAEQLGHNDIVRFLTTNLNEEKAANTKLNTVALRKGVNKKASTAA